MIAVMRVRRALFWTADRRSACTALPWAARTSCPMLASLPIHASAGRHPEHFQNHPPPRAQVIGVRGCACRRALSSRCVRCAVRSMTVERAADPSHRPARLAPRLAGLAAVGRGAHRRVGVASSKRAREPGNASASVLCVRRAARAHRSRGLEIDVDVDVDAMRDSEGEGGWGTLHFTRKRL